MAMTDSEIIDAVASGDIFINPFSSAAVQPASYDVRIGNKFAVFKSDVTEIDLRNVSDDLMEFAWAESVSDTETVFTLPPGGFALATTVESVLMPRDIVARVEGKSSLGRLGLLVHATAGFIDPGFSGQVTLELVNVSPVPIKIPSGAYIAQLAFQRLSRKVAVPYGDPHRNSKYQNQSGPMPSRYQM